MNEKNIVEAKAQKLVEMTAGFCKEIWTRITGS